MRSLKSRFKGNLVIRDDNFYEKVNGLNGVEVMIISSEDFKGQGDKDTG